MVIINYKFHYTQREGGICDSAGIHPVTSAATADTVPSVRESKVVCVVWWGIIFTAFSSSLIRSGDIQQLAGESDRTRKGDE